MLACGCELTAPHMSVDDIRLHLDSELGTIEGTRPDFPRPEPRGWRDPMGCSAPTPASNT